MWAILSCQPCWQIDTNLYSFFRLPDKLKHWPALLRGTEWEEQAKQVAREMETKSAADASQAAGMRVSHPATSQSTNEDREEEDRTIAETEIVDLRNEVADKDEKQQGADEEEGEAQEHRDTESAHDDEVDEHAGCGGCGHGHQEEELLADDKIPTKHADTVRTLSIFSPSAPPLPSCPSSAHLLAAVFHRLSEVSWSKLGHAYGAASDVPFFLRQLCHPRYTKRDAVVETLYSNIYHQGSLYSATPFAVPFLMDVLRICVESSALQAWDRTQRQGCLSHDNDPLSPSCHAAALVDVTSVLGLLLSLTQGYFGTHQVNKGYQKALQAGICSQLDVLLALLRHEDPGIVCHTMALLGRLEQREDEVIAALVPWVDPSVPPPNNKSWADITFEEDDKQGEPVPLEKRAEINSPVYSTATSAMAAIHQLAARYSNNKQLLSLCRSNLHHPACQPDIALRSAHTLVMHDKEMADEKALSVIVAAYGMLDALAKAGNDDADAAVSDVLTNVLAASAYLPSAQQRSCLLSSLRATRSDDFVLRLVQQLLSIDFTERWAWQDYSGAWTGTSWKLHGNYGLLVSDFMLRPGQKLATEEEKAEVWEKRQHPPTADDLTVEQKEVVQAMVQCDVLWDKHVTNYWEKYGLPKERHGLRQLVWREETDRLLPSIKASLAKSDASAEDNVKAMEALVLLQPSHPDVLALCSHVPLTSDKCSARLAYLASYMLLSAGRTEFQYVLDGLAHPDCCRVTTIYCSACLLPYVWPSCSPSLPRSQL